MKNAIKNRSSSVNFVKRMAFAFGLMIAFSPAFTAVLATPSVAAKFNLLTNTSVLSYAPQEQALEDRFSQFDSEEDMHELNDAWLGMPVKSSDGKLVGYVEDAYLGNDGEVTELLVSLEGQQVAVYVEGKYSKLSAENVSVDLAANVIAGLERSEEAVVSSR